MKNLITFIAVCLFLAFNGLVNAQNFIIDELGNDAVFNQAGYRNSNGVLKVGDILDVSSTSFSSGYNTLGMFNLRNTGGFNRNQDFSAFQVEGGNLFHLYRAHWITDPFHFGPNDNWAELGRILLRNPTQDKPGTFYGLHNQWSNYGAFFGLEGNKLDIDMYTETEEPVGWLGNETGRKDALIMWASYDPFGNNYGNNRLKFVFANGSSINPIYIEHMTILPTGEVGINTPNPTEKLHVVGNSIFMDGNVGINTDNPSEKLHVIGNSIFQGNVGIGTSDPTELLHVNGASIFINPTGGIGGPGSVYPYISIHSDPDFLFLVESPDVYQPQGTFDPYKGVLANFRKEKIEYQQDGEGYATGQHNVNITVENRYGMAQLGLDDGSGVKIGSRYVGYHGLGNLYFTTGENETKMTLRNTGMLGIGTTNPVEMLHVAGNSIIEGKIVISLPQSVAYSYGLDVDVGDELTKAISVRQNGIEQFRVWGNGTIGARAIHVTLGNFNPWPDYVFAPDYDLMSLKSLATYLEEHRSLPDVPTAKEVIEKGSIDLGEMQILLLKKFEEQILYTLQQQEEIEELKAENERLREMLESNNEIIIKQLQEEQEELKIMVLELIKSR